jgi:hypothetical protein
LHGFIEELKRGYEKMELSFIELYFITVACFVVGIFIGVALKNAI